jgi:hypothetical protein
MDSWCWQLTAARQAGTWHVRRGEGCADAFRTLEGARHLVLAAADGAGTARYGAAGSSAVSEAAVRLADARLANGGSRSAAFGPEAVREILEGTLDVLTRAATRAARLLAGGEPESETGDALLDAATALIVGGTANAAAIDPASGLELRDLHTTLLVALLTPERLAAANVGDGWLVARTAGAGLRVIARPARSEHANETFFLDSPGALGDAVLEVVEGREVDALALMTDGSARFAIDLSSGTPSAALFDKLFAFAADPTLARDERDRELARFLASERVSRATEDDITLVLAARVPGPGGS